MQLVIQKVKPWLLAGVMLKPIKHPLKDLQGLTAHHLFSKLKRIKAEKSGANVGNGSK
ncbi:MAG: hypothetical protein WBQ25_12490 [Nitrososphaeraceae archaeon]